MIYFFIFIIIFGLSYFGVEVFRRWSISREILDLPNERSSHETPTPRGGGLILVFVTLTSVFIYQMCFSDVIFWSYLAGAILISAISWLDDLYSLSAAWRFSIQITAGLLIIYQFDTFEDIFIPILGIVNLSPLSFLFIIIWIVWFTNAFNFMDGIDGIAAVQALTASMGWFFVGYHFNIEIYQFIALIVFSSTLGFLFHNWQPARIFMGDVGSAFLGFSFAVFPFFSKMDSEDTNQSSYILFYGIMFVWLFLFDTVFTFLNRLIKREKVWQAHRSHLYQKLVLKGFTHSSVAIFYGTLSFFQLIVTMFCLIINRYERTFIVFTILITTVLVLTLLKDVRFDK